VRMFYRLLIPAVAIAGCLVVAATVAPSRATPTPKAAGGANQRTSVEGCINQFVFNGVWRVKVLSVAPATVNDGVTVKGTGIRLQIRNGTSKDLELDNAGFDSNARGISLVYDDDSQYQLATVSGFYALQQVPPGGAYVTTLNFVTTHAPDTAKPAKLLIAQYPDKLHTPGVHFTTKSPSFRVHLDCKK